MRNTIYKVAVSASLFGILLTAVPAQAATLTQAQVQAVVQLLQSFGVDQGTVANVENTLGVTSNASTTSASCLSLYNNLYLDQTDANTNSEVSKLQQFLGGRVTGYFGPATEQLVQNWQSSHGVTSSGSPDTTGFGYVGPKTRSALACGANGISGSTTGSISTPPSKLHATARDTQRITNLRTIQLTLEEYWNDHKLYPTTTASVQPNYIAAIPVDPLDSTAYMYVSNGTTYTLSANLENANDAPKSGGTLSTTNCAGINNGRFCYTLSN